MELSARAAHRGQITKIAKAASDYLKDEGSQLTDAHLPQFDEIEEELVSLIQRLTAVNDSLNTLNEELKQKGLLKAEDPPEKTLEYQDLAVGTLARLNVRLSKLRQKQNLNCTSEEPGNTFLSAKTFACSAKLPKLPLKRFDGNLDNWLPFWEQFRSAVHENAILSPSEKFNYLDSVLTGEAKRSIAGFTPSAKCYDSAVALLQEQYGNSDRLIDKHIQQLINLSTIRDKADIVGLRNLYGKVIACTRSLTALQVPSTHYYIMLRSILLRCLPTELRISYHRQLERTEDLDGNEPPSNSSESSLSLTGGDEVKDILRFLKREVESLERSGISHTIIKSKTNDLATASSLIVLGDENMCIFCKSKEHKTKDCDSKISLSEKRTTLRTTGRCFRCAKRGHSSQKCRSSKYLSCDKCHGKHMTSMCYSKLQGSAPVTLTKSRYQGGSMTNEKESNALNLCTHNSKSNIFLKTVKCTALGADQALSIRAIIDGGSQFTYIRERVANKLKLKCLGQVKLSVIPFGSKKVNTVEAFAKVEVKLKSTFKEAKVISLEAVVVPEICVDILETPQEDLALFKNLKLADVQPRGIEFEDGLSLLIGSDYYWSIITGKQRRLTDRLRAIETVFGWALQGIHNPVSENMQTFDNISCFSTSNLLSMACVPEPVHDFWSLETIGIMNTEDENDSLTKEMISACITREGSRYVAKLPWKNPSSVLHNNKAQAAKRLLSLYRLEELGATRVFELGLGDDDANIEDDFITWKDRFWPAVCDYFGIEGGGEEVLIRQYRLLEQPDVQPDRIYTGEIARLHSLQNQRPPFDAKNPFLASIKVNRELHKGGSRSCMHIELDIEGSKMRYEAGDHVAMYPINNKELVEKLGELCGADLDKVFSLINTDTDSSKKHPFPCPTTYRTALTHYLEITAVPRTHILKELAEENYFCWWDMKPK